MDDSMIRGSGGMGKAPTEEQHTPVEAPDTLHSVAYARIIDLLSEGECEMFENGLQDIYLDETPLQNPDGSFNFKNVYVDIRSGTQYQEPLDSFPEVESETAVGVLLETTTPWTHNFTNTALTGVRVRLAVAALSEVDPETDDTNGYVVEFAIDLSVDGGGYTEILRDEFNGKASSPYERSYVIVLPEATTNWLLRVRRITPEANTQYIQDQTSVVSYTELIRANLRMPNSAVVGLRIDASQFRAIPTRAYRLKGRIIRVPANYDPITRIYTGSWDGTFKVAWTNNPAWIYFDMATNYRYGLGRFLADAQVDKWSLYQIGQYCDELVDDGLGGSEPRFTCDLYLQKQADAYKVMQDLASVFRGISFWAAGKIMAIADRPADPVYTFNNSNVINGRFSYQGSSRQARHTVALVSWGDPSDFGRGKVEYVPDEDGIARYGIQQLSMTAIGASSQGQAHRCGVWALLSERLETNTVTFGVGLDGTIPQPGHIIRIADRLRDAARRGGRVRAATTSVITPDVMPTVAVGFNLTVILPTGISQTRPVSAVGASTITVSPAFDAAPVTDAAWIIESEEAPASLWKVLGVTEEANEKSIAFSVLAIVHDPAKFEASDFGITIQPQDPAQKPSRVQAAPATVTLTTRTVYDGPTARNVLSVAWDQVPTALRYEISLRRNLEEWTPLVRVRGTLYEVPNVLPGDWIASVKAIGYTGIASQPRVSATLTIGALQQSEVLTDFTTGEVLVDFETGNVLNSL
jgi:predicted phage tail protein